MIGRAIVVILTLLLIVSLLGANMAVAMDRGVLDDEYVTERLADADAYETIHAELLSELDGELEGMDDDLPGQIDADQIVADTITVEFIQSQTEDSIGSIYAFLHGETETLELVINLGELRDNLEQAVATQVAGLSLEDIGIEPIELEVEDRPVFIDPAALDEGESAYNDELASFEDQVKTIIEEVYEEETGEEPDEETVEDLYEEQLEEMEDEIIGAMNQALAGADLPAELEAAAEDMGVTIALAYINADDHAQFDAELQDDKEAIGQAAASFATDELPDDFEEFDLGDEIDEEELQPVVDAVSDFGTLQDILLITSAVLVGLVFLVSRSFSTVFKSAGIAAILVGVIGLGLALLAPDLVEEVVVAELDSEDISEAMLELMVDIVAMVFDPMLLQSAGLVAAGAVLTIGGIVFSGGSGGNN